MQLKPWREIAVPHRDVLEGTFLDAEFAADLSRVREGSAGPEYADPGQFFDRTFITEGMRLLLDGVARRLNGRGGDPVIQLQTAFGGGKTHTMLAVYHLALGKTPPRDLRGIPKILDDAGIDALPRAQVAVIDGNRIGPAEPRRRGKVTVRCLWGEIAWQLGGEAAYALVAESDAAGTSPGKEVLIELLRRHAPVVILMDETVAYLRQFQDGKSYPAGTFDSNLSFIQALTESVTAVPTATLLASLPESHTEVGSTQGQRALAALEKYFGRVQALWKPVATEEAFEIVRRRLFNPIADSASAEAVCRAFADHYGKHAEHFPVETQEARYLQRLRDSYPIHPEVFARLYEDWSTLDGFQRTRGVLKLMAKVIYRLFKDGNTDLMIMPGSLPLYDSNVRNESIYYLPQGWDPVIERDIDGDRAETTAIDTQDPRLGALQAARRVARTIFLGSAPSGRAQMVRGVEEKRVELGASQPGTQPSVFHDALGRLSDRLHYLNAGDGRYWFDTRPNLRREMEERKRKFENREHVDPAIRERLSKLLSKGCFGGVHVFTPSADIPDDLELRLVVLSPDSPYVADGGPAVLAAQGILDRRGDQPRVRRNRLVFLAADNDSLSRLRDQVRTFLAWQSMQEDVANTKLNLDLLQIQQVNRSAETAASGLNRMLAECYRRLLCPGEVEKPGGKGFRLEWESFTISGDVRSLTAEIEAKLQSEEAIIAQWSPVHLDALLVKWYWRADKAELGAMALWQDMGSYLYMPRLVGCQALQAAITAGVAAGEYFGYTDAREGDRLRGLRLGATPGVPVYVTIDKDSLLIRRDAAAALLAEQKRHEETAKATGSGTGAGIVTGTGAGTTTGGGGTDGTGPGGKPVLRRRFYGTAHLDAHTGRVQFDEIHSELISLLIAKPGVAVTVKLDIEAEAPQGFDENTVRAARENAKTLGFDQAEFE
jgi:predicted AAA+ superfamily ATPase